MFGLARSARKIGNNPMGTASKLKAAIRTAGFRIIACKNGKRVKLYSRPGNDLTYRFPLIVEAVAKLRSQSCIIDGEAISCGDDGIASFDRIRFGSVGDAPRSTCMRKLPPYLMDR